jgi:hypothetical protein
MNLDKLSDDELLSSLHTVCLDTRRLAARVVIYLGEIEERRLHLKAAYPSMFEFCLRRLNMSGGEAFRRLASRAVRKAQGHPPRSHPSQPAYFGAGGIGQ